MCTSCWFFVIWFFFVFFFFSSRRRHTRCALVTGVQTCSYYVLMSQEPPSPPAGHPDPRTLRLFDLAPHEAILVRCECGRMAYATDVFWKVDMATLFSIPVRAPVPVDQRGEDRKSVV